MNLFIESKGNLPRLSMYYLGVQTCYPVNVSLPMSSNKKIVFAVAIMPVKLQPSHTSTRGGEEGKGVVVGNSNVTCNGVKACVGLGSQ